MAVQAHATAKYIRTSAQKAGLVMNLIRGRDVNSALATLRFARKGVAKDVEKVLRSAIANAQQKEGFGGDVERLFVNVCYANQGPSQKRIRPAPMGRAFRVVKRTAHLTVQVAERPSPVAAVAAPPAADEPTTAAAPPSTPKRARGAKPKAKPRRTGSSRALKTSPERKCAGTRKRHAGGGGRAKKKTGKS